MERNRTPEIRIKMKYFIFRALVVIILALVIYFGLTLFSGIFMQRGTQGNESQRLPGPVGTPYVKGPTGPPPQN